MQAPRNIQRDVASATPPLEQFAGTGVSKRPEDIAALQQAPIMLLSQDKDRERREIQKRVMERTARKEAKLQDQAMCDGISDMHFRLQVKQFGGRLCSHGMLCASKT